MDTGEVPKIGDTLRVDGLGEAPGRRSPGDPQPRLTARPPKRSTPLEGEEQPPCDQGGTVDIRA